MDEINQGNRLRNMRAGVHPVVLHCFINHLLKIKPKE